MLYAQKGEKWTNGEDVKLNIDVLEVPVLIKYFPIENMNIYAGPTLDYILSAKVEMDSGDLDLKEEELIKTMGFGLSFGTQYIMDKIVLDARYDMGLTDLNDEAENDEEIKLNTIYISVGYMF
ncbi:MAG: PorT family protein [Candidatus Mcinerneyibacterium aminivorans]|uniref:PorT family protein n=1 Tax=Candidatus Mcinerneyibacterium aminivorans TaxID=2703815 RepID=A0A5D0ML81_9BACT|nr:MAG: PorT family protein [Candidatus Mcinerneyibacterium aminivorans]